MTLSRQSLSLSHLLALCLFAFPMAITAQDSTNSTSPTIAPTTSPPTMAPTVTMAPSSSMAPSNGPNDCDRIVPGDVYFHFISSLDPDAIAIFLFEDLPGNIKLYLTDNAWTGTNFQNNEGTLELTTPAAGIPMGTSIGYGNNGEYADQWVAVEGAFALSEEGEQVFLYCFGGNGNIVPLAALSYNGPFDNSTDKTSFAFDESALPERLATNGTIVLEHCDTWEYTGTQSAEVEELRAAMQNTDNWSSTGKCGDSSGFIPSVGGTCWMVTFVLLVSNLLLLE